MRGSLFFSVTLATTDATRVRASLTRRRNDPVHIARPLKGRAKIIASLRDCLIMSDRKVLRLVKKAEGELPEKAFSAKSVAKPEPKPASPPIKSIKPVPARRPPRQHERPRLS